MYNLNDYSYRTNNKVIPLHENRNGKRIHTEDIKGPKLTTERISICKIVSFCCQPHYVLLEKVNTLCQSSRWRSRAHCNKLNKDIPGNNTRTATF